MTIGIGFRGSEGAVLTADSRLTLEPEGMRDVKATYDHASKLLRFKPPHDFVGVAVYDGAALGKDYPKWVRMFVPELQSFAGPIRLPVEEFARKLGQFFDAATPAPPRIGFLVAGFDEGALEYQSKFFTVNVPGSVIVERKPPVKDFGPVVVGQSYIAERILFGFDSGLLSWVRKFPQFQPFTDDEWRKTADGLEDSMRSHLWLTRAYVPCNFLPLQECINLSVFLVEATAAFQTWIAGDRGVGGPVDVMTITNTEGARVIREKRLFAGEGFLHGKTPKDRIRKPRTSRVAR